MKILRQGRRPRLCWSRQLVCSLATTATMPLVLGAAMLLPAHAAMPSHTHRPLPTSLHTSSLAQAGGHGTTRHSKGAVLAKAHAVAPSSRATRSHGADIRSKAPKANAAAAGAHAHGAEKRAGKKGKRQREEDSEPAIPMLRAHGGMAPRGSGRNRPAPLMAKKDRAVPHWVTSGKGGRHAETGTPLSVVTTHRKPEPAWMMAHNTTAPTPAATTSSRHHEVSSPTTPAPAPRNIPVRPEAFAQGVAHPEGDESLPRVRSAPEDDADTAVEQAPAPVARVTAAPSATPVVPPARTPLVQGFGGEVAVPPSAAPATDRPGGTRRRTHPNSWQPDALVAPPEPLEEREAVLDAAVSPAVLPEVYDRGGRVLMPAPLRGSRDILVHQNLMAMTDGLEKVYDDADLDRLRAAHRLVGFPVSDSLRMNPDLPWNRRVARPWTVAFTAALGRAFYEQFHQPLQVNSAVRTIRYQAHLQLVNGNAAGTYGEAASPHLTGQAVDLAKRGMSAAELAWMRDALLPLMRSGKIDVEEEFQQACFHISVYRSYTANRHSPQVAQVRRTASGGDEGNPPDR